MASLTHALVAVVAVLVLGACGDDDGSLTQSGPTTAATVGGSTSDGVPAGDTIAPARSTPDPGCQLTAEEATRILGAPMELTGGDKSCLFRDPNYDGTGPKQVIVSLDETGGRPNFESHKKTAPSVRDVGGVGDAAFSMRAGGITGLVVLDGSASTTILIGDDQPLGEAVDTLKELYRAARS